MKRALAIAGTAAFWLITITMIVTTTYAGTRPDLATYAWQTWPFLSLQIFAGTWMTWLVWQELSYRRRTRRRTR